MLSADRRLTTAQIERFFAAPRNRFWIHLRLGTAPAAA
jgi:hypothetical protein